jgi:hypothetical protein
MGTREEQAMAKKKSGARQGKLLRSDIKALRTLGNNLEQVRKNLRKFHKQVTMYSWEPYKKPPPPGK